MPAGRSGVAGCHAELWRAYGFGRVIIAPVHASISRAVHGWRRAKCVLDVVVHGRRGRLEIFYLLQHIERGGLALPRPPPLRASSSRHPSPYVPSRQAEFSVSASWRPGHEISAAPHPLVKESRVFERVGETKDGSKPK